ncbi:MAG: hypothetical protein GDA49_02805 [Rhodospirillales bacterium]|nr:hypothetical protein [Rhodospirillales bacterium]
MAEADGASFLQETRELGVNASRGICAGLAGLGHCVGRGSGGFIVNRHRHRAFEDAWLGYGDVPGGDSRVFGYEVDGLDHIVGDSLPFPTGEDGAPEGIEILAMGPATNAEADFSL